MQGRGFLHSDAAKRLFKLRGVDADGEGIDGHSVPAQVVKDVLVFLPVPCRVSRTGGKGAWGGASVSVRRGELGPQGGVRLKVRPG